MRNYIIDLERVNYMSRGLCLDVDGRSDIPRAPIDATRVAVVPDVINIPQIRAQAGTHASEFEISIFQRTPRPQRLFYPRVISTP